MNLEGKRTAYVKLITFKKNFITNRKKKLKVNLIYFLLCVES